MRISRKLLAIASCLALSGMASANAMAQPGHGYGSGMTGRSMMHGMGHGTGMGHGAGMGHGPSMRHGAGMGRMMGGMMGPMAGLGNPAFANPAERLASIRTELALRPDQTSAWEDFARAVNAASAARTEAGQHFDPAKIQAMTPDERQQHFTAAWTRRNEARTQVQSAAQALLAKLDESQKAKAQQLLPGLTGAGFGPRGMARGPMMGGRGFGPGHRH